jgi:hypothetical protein
MEPRGDQESAVVFHVHQRKDVREAVKKNMNMTFGLEKCARICLKKGRV